MRRVGSASREHAFAIDPPRKIRGDLSMNRNYALDVLKLVCALWIAIMHYGVTAYGGPVVEIFFVISGYYLLNSFDSGKYEKAGAGGYLWSRAKRMYPHYLFSLIILFFAFDYGTFHGWQWYIDRVGNLFPELCFIQNIGVFDGGLNAPLWQLSTLLIASYLLFGLLGANRNLTVTVISPVVAMMYFTYEVTVIMKGANDHWGVIAGCIGVAMFRATGSLCLGIAINPLIKKVSSFMGSNWRGWGVSVVSLLSILLYLVYKDSLVSLIIFAVLFACILSGKGVLCSLFNRSIFRMCEKLSLSVYFNHRIVLKVLHPVFGKLGDIPLWAQVAIYVPVLLVYSFCAYVAVERLMGYIRKKREQKVAAA